MLGTSKCFGGKSEPSPCLKRPQTWPALRLGEVGVFSSGLLEALECGTKVSSAFIHSSLNLSPTFKSIGSTNGPPGS